MGPRTRPAQAPLYLQVFALDTTIPVDAAATYVSLTGAMKDHILASGEVVGKVRSIPPRRRRRHARRLRSNEFSRRKTPGRW